MKKLLAVLLSIALVCGVCMTSFAAGAVKNQVQAKAGQAAKEEFDENQIKEVVDATINDLIQYELEDEEETNGIGPKLLEAFQEAYDNGTLTTENLQAFLITLAIVTYFDDDDFEDYEAVHFLAELLDNEFNTDLLEEDLALIEEMADEFDFAGYEHEYDPEALIAYILEYSDDEDEAELDSEELAELVGLVIALGLADDDDNDDLELLSVAEEAAEEELEEDSLAGLLALLALAGEEEAAEEAAEEELEEDGLAGLLALLALAGEEEAAEEEAEEEFELAELLALLGLEGEELADEALITEWLYELLGIEEGEELTEEDLKNIVTLLVFIGLLEEDADVEDILEVFELDGDEEIELDDDEEFDEEALEAFLQILFAK